MVGQAWPLVRWVLLTQLALTMVAAAMVVPFAGLWKALFVVLGGLVAMALGLVFALRLFAVDASEDPAGALRALRRGATAKLIGAVVVFTLAAKWMPQHVAQIIIGFAAATISYWIALLRAPLGDATATNEGTKSEGHG